MGIRQKKEEGNGQIESQQAGKREAHDHSGKASTGA
jgi:hypothetical protein